MADVSLQLNEYHWTGSGYSYSGSYIIDPPPSSIEKSTKAEWRITHRGSRREFPVCKWRFRRTEEITIKGIIRTETARRTLEAYSMRNSRFTLEFSSARFKSTGTVGPYHGASFTDVYGFFVITEARFSQVPGTDDFEYQIKFIRVA